MICRLDEEKRVMDEQVKELTAKVPSYCISLMTLSVSIAHFSV